MTMGYIFAAASDGTLDHTVHSNVVELVVSSRIYHTDKARPMSLLFLGIIALGLSSCHLLYVGRHKIRNGAGHGLKIKSPNKNRRKRKENRRKSQRKKYLERKTFDVFLVVVACMSGPWRNFSESSPCTSVCVCSAFQSP